MDGDREFRFMGANMPGLVLPYDFTQRLPDRLVLPTRWEQEDAMKTLDQMNLCAVRTWCVPVRPAKEKSPDGRMTWHYVQGPGQFNEESFKCIDNLLDLANRYGVRIVFSFVDNWGYVGGIEDYAAHRNRRKAEFWTDPQVRDDFKATVRYIIDRRNSLTGTRYKDDKAILCWEFGNELRGAPAEWRADLAAFIKSIDANHLVMDGRDDEIPAEPDANVDIYTRHYYRGNYADNCRRDARQFQGKRPWIIGEFGPYIDGKLFTEETVLPKVEEFYEAVCKSNTAGAMLWIMYFHHRDGGFYWHQIFTYPATWSYHWPGFPSAAAQKERELLSMLRRAAFQIQGREMPRVPRPDAPQLLPIGAVPLISWRGSAGADGYDVERAGEPAGPWTKLAENVSDADLAYRPLWSDTTAKAGDTWHYRVIARNASGQSPPSNVVGPVTIKAVCFVDELLDFRLAAGHSPGLSINNSFNALYAEYLFRAKGDKNEWLLYEVPAAISSFRVVAFAPTEAANLQFEHSTDGKTFVSAAIERKTTPLNPPPQGAVTKDRMTLSEYRCETPAGARFVKITWTGPAEVDRVEIVHPGRGA